MGIWGWWAFDLFTLIASYISPEVMAAQTLLRSLGIATLMVPIGLATSVGTLVGNMVGAAKPERARTYYQVGLALGLVATTV